MSTKTLVYICAFIGSVVGSYVPNLWGASLFSFSSILLGGIGGVIGVFVGLRLGR